MENNNLTENDFVAVVIDNELRGKSNLRKYDNNWFVNVTVSVDSSDKGEPEFYLYRESTKSVLRPINKIDVKMKPASSNFVSINSLPKLNFKESSLRKIPKLNTKTLEVNDIDSLFNSNIRFKYFN